MGAPNDAGHRSDLFPITLPTLKTGLVLRHPDPISGALYSAVELLPDNRGTLVLNQRRLPLEETYEHVVGVDHMAEAIRTLKVRGAPSIGVAAAYGMVLAALPETGDAASFTAAMHAGGALLAATRPTAVNLAWAIGKMLDRATTVAGESPDARVASLAECARSLHRAEVAACKKMGALVADRVKDGATILTHCNAGALATAGFGSALGVVRAARAQGKDVRVIACETRPVLQGARMTAWELAKDGIPVTLITDSMVAQLMARGGVDLVVVGADRIARSGDVANKIGTYGVACLARVHEIPFYVAAPWSTFDMDCARGADIPIEQRDPEEVLSFPTRDGAVRIAPEGVSAQNPSFDVTPARLVTAIFTERGVIDPVTEAGVRALA